MGYKYQINLSLFSKMAKVRFIERERYRRNLSRKYFFLRSHYTKAFAQRDTSYKRFCLKKRYRKIPLRSAPVRSCAICQLSGRSRGYYGDFGVSRHFFREFARQGILPGVEKSTWLY